MEDMDFSSVFFDELREKLEEAENSLKNYFESKDVSYLKELYRVFHTIKGSASLVGFSGFQRVAHKIEEIFKDIYENKREISQQDTARIMRVISVFKDKKDDLTESEIEKILKFLEGEISNLDDEGDSSTNSEFESLGYHEILESVIKVENNIILGNVNLATIELRNLKKYLNELIQTKEFVQVDRLFDGFDNLVFQESTLNGKKVRLVLECQDLKIPIKDVQALRDSLVHIVRNSIAHGIEPPNERKKLGKSEEGIIKISTHLDSENISIIVEDDGSGIDLERVKEKMRFSGYDTIDPLEVIFQPGFSTRDSSDLSSGRGMGLYAAKTFIESRGGSINIRTERGKGTKFIIRLPIMFIVKKVIVVRSDTNIFAIDLSEVLFVQNNPNVFEFNTSKSLRYNDELYELLTLGEFKSRTFGVFLKNKRAILVDEILGIFDGQFVQQRSNISKYFVKNIFPFPVPVIDFELIKNTTSSFEKQKTSERKATVLIVDDSNITRLVVQSFLESRGYKVMQAKNGIEALEKSGFDLAIVDIEMPGIDGYETTKRLKKKFPEIPVIILTTRSSTEDVRKGLESGANAYMIKGENLERLLTLIERFLKG